MSISQSRAAYVDCYEYFDRALEEDVGIRLRVPDVDKATFLRMRLHTARVIRRRDNAEIYKPGDPMYNASPYDQITVKIANDDGKFYVILEKVQFIVDIEPLEPIEGLKTLEAPKARAEIEQDEPLRLTHESIQRRV